MFDKKANIYSINWLKSENMFEKTIDKQIYVRYYMNIPNKCLQRMFEERIMTYSEKARYNKLKRKAQLRKRILAASLSFVFIFSLSMLFKINSHASDGREEELYKYYKSIQIKPNDTLIGLAGESNYESESDFVQEVCFMNGISSEDVLITGCYLVIPYYDTFHN